MGRSATLCRSTRAALTPSDWRSVYSHRVQLNANLTSYLKEEACVEGVPRATKKPGSYLYELSRACLSIVKEELLNLMRGRDDVISSTLSFAVIYTELWRQATLVQLQDAGVEASSVRWSEPQTEGSKDPIDIEELQRLNEKWNQWSGETPEQKIFVDLACNLAEGYLKALDEFRVAAEEGDARVIKHHMALLGDIAQEMLALHATLLPVEAARLSSR